MFNYIIDLIIFGIYVMIIFSKFNIPSDLVTKTMLIIIILIISYRNIILGFAAAIMYIIKHYVPKEGFKQKKQIKLHKDLLSIDESLRSKDSNSLFYMNHKSNQEDISPYNL